MQQGCLIRPPSCHMMLNHRKKTISDISCDRRPLDDKFQQGLHMTTHATCKPSTPHAAPTHTVALALALWLFEYTIQVKGDLSPSVPPQHARITVNECIDRHLHFKPSHCRTFQKICRLPYPAQPPGFPSHWLQCLLVRRAGIPTTWHAPTLQDLDRLNPGRRGYAFAGSDRYQEIFQCTIRQKPNMHPTTTTFRVARS